MLHSPPRLVPHATQTKIILVSQTRAAGPVTAGSPWRSQSMRPHNIDPRGGARNDTRTVALRPIHVRG